MTETWAEGSGSTWEPLECGHLDCTRPAMDGYAYCADHQQMADDAEGGGWQIAIGDPADRSGESALDALRDWTRRPMGTR